MCQFYLKLDIKKKLPEKAKSKVSSRKRTFIGNLGNNDKKEGLADHPEDSVQLTSSFHCLFKCVLFPQDHLPWGGRGLPRKAVKSVSGNNSEFSSRVSFVQFSSF